MNNRRRMVQKSVCMCVLLLGTMASLRGSLHGQYLDPEEDRTLVFRGVTAGVMARDFAPRPSNTEPDSIQIRYRQLMPVLGFRQGPVEVMFGYTTYSLQGRSRSAVFFGTTITADLPLGGSRKSMLAVPLMLAADYTKGESAGPQRDNFNVASIGLGVGLRFRGASETVDWSVSTHGVAHYCFEGLSTGAGFSGAVIAETVAFFPRVGLLDGLIAGYRFRLQTWSLRDGQFDYRVITHGPFVGVLL